MGRPVKPKDANQIKTAATRLKDYRTSEKITQETLSEILGVDVSSVKRYEKGQGYLMSRKAANRLARKTKTSCLYWLGFPDEDVKYDELFGDELDNAEYVPSSLNIQKQQQIINIKNAFDVFDAEHRYEYRNIEGTAEYDFDGVPDPSGCIVRIYCGPHLIVSTSDSSAWVSFAEPPKTFNGWYALIHSLEQKRSE